MVTTQMRSLNPLNEYQRKNDTEIINHVQHTIMQKNCLQQNNGNQTHNAKKYNKKQLFNRQLQIKHIMVACRQEKPPFTNHNLRQIVKQGTDKLNNYGVLK